MDTASKRWATVAGFVIVAVAIVVGTYWSDMRKRAERLVTTLVSPITPSAPGPSDPALTVPVSKSDTPPPANPASRTVAPLPPPADTAVPSAPAHAAEKPASETPHFDVVRVEPNGDTVLAGQGAPNSSVDLLASGKVVAQAPTDPNGHFVMLPPALKPGDYALTLRQPGAGARGTPSAESAQSVAVSVPEKNKGPVVVALAEPGQPTKLLSPPPGIQPDPAAALAAAPAPAAPTPLAPSSLATVPPGPPPVGAVPTTPSPASAKADSAPPKPTIPPSRPVAAPSGPALAVRSVELENGNGFYASGVAAPGTKLRLYLNDSHIADVVAGADAAWSVTIKKGLTGGHYVVRADAASDGSKVTARVEVPFDVPVTMAEAPRPPPPAPVAKVETPTPPRPEMISPAVPPASPPGVASTAPAPPVRRPPSSPAVSVPEAKPPMVASEPAPSIEAKAPPPPEAAAPRPSPHTAPVPEITPPVASKLTPSIEAKALSPPAAPSVETASKPAPPLVEAAAKPDAVIEEIKTTLVRTGDNLWDISRVRLGQGRRYTRIYAANLSQIRDPSLIYPGQVFVLPAGND